MNSGLIAVLAVALVRVAALAAIGFEMWRIEILRRKLAREFGLEPVGKGELDRRVAGVKNTNPA
jgi:hypothetical protein